MTRSLQEQLDSIPDLVDYFYNDTIAPHVKHQSTLSPVPPVFTNWRDEQRAWRESAILFDQGHHMPELFLTGPDARKLIERVAINGFKNYGPGRAKQLIGCNEAGRVIGESVMHCHADDSFELISGMTLLNWVHYQAESGGYDVEIRRDHHTAMNPGGAEGRTNFRYGMDGPNAEAIFKEIVKGAAPEIPFFRTARVKIAGIDVLALRHGMAGHFGVELSGPYDQGDKVRETILAAGEPYGLKQGGTTTYFSTLGESGWMPFPLPGIYSDDNMRGFREWLPAEGWEARQQLGGSYRSPNIEDYYVTPWDLGVDRVMKFDHDFIGRDALESLAEGEKRRRVTLVWNTDDLMAIHRSLFEPGIPCKYMELPVSQYSFQHTDSVLAGDELVGLATYTGYTVNEDDMLSVAMVGEAHAEPGTELTLVWGEPDGGSRKPHVEKHRQTTVRVTVAPAPYAQAVRQFKTKTVA